MPDTPEAHAATPSGRPDRPPRESLLGIVGSAIWTGFKRAIVVLAVLLVVPAAAWLWAGSEGSLDTALRWAAQAPAEGSPALQASGVTGSLRGGGRAAELTWQSEGLRMKATDVELRWQPLALLSRSINVQRLRAASLELEPIERADAPPSAPPASLRIPLPARLSLRIDEVDIDQLIWQGATPVTTGKLRGRYSYTGPQHQIELAELVWADGRYQGKAQVDSDAPFSLQAALSGTLAAPMPAGAPALPLALQASAQGPLADSQVQANLSAAPPSAPPTTPPTTPSTTPSTPGQAVPGNSPQAQVKARVTPWGALPVTDAQASFRALDLALLWPAAPQTRLSGQASVQPLPDNAWRLQLDARNASPGPWDRQRLPAEQVKAEGEWRGGQALLRSLDARLGGGRLQGSGQWQPAPQPPGGSANAAPGDEGAWQFRSTLEGINAAALYSALPAQRLSGRASAQSAGPRVGFDVALQASGAPGVATTPSRKDSAALIKQLGQLQLREVNARGAWVTAARAPGSPAKRTAPAGTLDLAALRVRSVDAELQAKGMFQPGLSGGRGEVSLRAPGLALTAEGELQPTRGDGKLTLNATDAQRALRWLDGLPGLPAVNVLQEASARGQARLTLAWQGGWRDPLLQAQLNVPQLDWSSADRSPSAPAKASSPAANKPAVAPEALRLRDVQASLNGRLSQARLSLQGRAESAARRASLQLQADAGAMFDTRRAAPVLLRWQGVLRQLELSYLDPALSSGAWRVGLQQPVAARGTSDSFALDAGQAVLTAPAAVSSNVARGTPTQAVLAWQPTRWQAGEWITAGSIRGLPLAWAEAMLGSPLGQADLSGALLFDGHWDVVLGSTFKLKAQLARSSGDLTVQAETAEGLPARVAAGLREARLDVQSEGGAVTAQLRWASERAGNVQADLRTQLSRQTPAGQTEPRWQWPDDAPLTGQIKAQLPRIGVWSVLAPPGWRLRGAVAADLTVQGTRGDPQLRGTLEANDLALRSVVDGIELGNGRLRAQLEGTRMRINEFSLQGAGPRGTGGVLRAEGEAAWVAGQPQVMLNTRLERLRVSVRNDRQITLSGQLQGLLVNGQPEINGLLKVDQARITLPSEDRPQLGDDVVVRGLPTQAAASRGPRAPVKLAVQIDLGEDFLIQGRGVDTRMRGILALLGDSMATPKLYGTLLTFNGQYRAYGQRLDIEEGVLRFAGPIDNPALEILAIRPNLTQRVGVQISGTALLPRVRLYAEPELPDAEKLSWLVLGRSSASGGAEAALLQQAALALLGSRTGADTGGLAATFGLDELSIRAPGGATENGSASGGAITLGKRFSRNFYAAYERSLSGAVGTLFLFYDLSQRLTVRAQAGEQAAVDLIFTVPYE